MFLGTKMMLLSLPTEYETLFYGVPRSIDWDTVRRQQIKIQPLCQVCDSKIVDVHHIKPYHLFPKLELILKNLITLCRAHHLLFGHCMYWLAYNKYVISDVNRIRKHILTRAMK